MGLFDLNLGPILLGTMMSVLLLGIMIVQCYIYFDRFPNDKWWIKAVVWLLLLLDVVTSAFAMATSYNYLITNFGNIAGVQKASAAIIPYPMLTGVTSTVVQCFFAWRINVLTRNRILALAIAVLSVISMLASIGTMIGLIIIKELANLPRIKQVSLVWLLGSVVTDALVTIGLVRYLSNHQTGFAITDNVTGKIIRLTVQTGLLTTTCALIVVVMFLVSDSTIDIGFGFALSKLYTVSLMSSLNARKAWNPTGYASESAVSRSSNRRSYAGQSISFGATSSGLTANNSTGQGSESHELSFKKALTPMDVSISKVSMTV